MSDDNSERKGKGCNEEDRHIPGCRCDERKALMEAATPEQLAAANDKIAKIRAHTIGLLSENNINPMRGAEMMLHTMQGAGMYAEEIDGDLFTGSCFKYVVVAAVQHGPLAILGEHVLARDEDGDIGVHSKVPHILGALGAIAPLLNAIGAGGGEIHGGSIADIMKALTEGGGEDDDGDLPDPGDTLTGGLDLSRFFTSGGQTKH